MTEDQALEAIAARWAASWAVLRPTITFALGNEAKPTQGLAAFATLGLQGTIATRQLTQGPVGSRRFERKGTIAVRLFSAADAGDNFPSLLVKDARTSLESQSIAGAGGTVYMGASDTQAAKQGSWYVRTVLIPFTYYETR